MSDEQPQVDEPADVTALAQQRLDHPEQVPLVPPAGVEHQTWRGIGTEDIAEPVTIDNPQAEPHEIVPACNDERLPDKTEWMEPRPTRPVPDFTVPAGFLDALEGYVSALFHFHHAAANGGPTTQAKAMLDSRREALHANFAE